MTFKAIYLTLNSDGTTHSSLQILEENQLKNSENVTVDIDYSSLNYKDALAITGKRPVVRNWPMIPGIDGAGTISSSSSPLWLKGDQFLINGWGLGETRFGCLSQRASLAAKFLTPLPLGLSARNAMAIGTAGYTAMLSILALEKHGLTPADGEILVTGASGGVGSIAIALLSDLGYIVTASTGKLDQSDYLRQLGAKDVIDRSSIASPGKPIQKERWAAVVDSVGSHTLTNALAQTIYGGTVTACGMAQGMDLPGSVAPFILRAVKLIGIDSVMSSVDDRQTAWRRLATDMNLRKLEIITEEITLDDVISYSENLLKGSLRGRVVVKCGN